MTILDTLAAEARLRVEADLGHTPLSEMKARALDMPRLYGYPFGSALQEPGLSFICEVKKASPSKGLISPDFPYLDIARDYEAAGAAAISVLTEPKHFLGSDRYLKEIAAEVSIPILRKDFTVDAYQIYQAQVLGASAVLLICSILTDAQLTEFLEVADSLGLSVLTEAHDAEEVERAVRAGARIIGANNRNLKDFSIDSLNSATLRAVVPPNRLYVSESGVTGPEDTAAAAAMGADAVLIGEALMRAADRRVFLRELKAAADAALETAPRSSLSGRRLTHEIPSIKICGISREEDIPVLNETLPEYVGFVFHPPSRRYINLERAVRLRGLLDERIRTVGVFVDAPLDQIKEALESGAISIVQLHGHEDAAYIAAFRQAFPSTTYITAVGVRDAQSIVDTVKMGAFYILIDNVNPGSGKPCDRDIFEEARDLAWAQGLGVPPIFIAGGLNPDNVGEVVSTGVFAVDVSSGVETNGHKDPALIRAFIAAARDVTDAPEFIGPKFGSTDPEFLISPGGEQ